MKRLSSYLKDSSGTLKGIYYSFEPDVTTWQQWEEELGQDSQALKTRYKKWAGEVREYFNELNEIFTGAKNWAVRMWFADPQFLVQYAFSHKIAENHLDNMLRKAFEELAISTQNLDWQVPLPTQKMLGGNKNEGGKLGALLRCLIRETIAPVRAHVSSMLVHSLLLLYLCRASALAYSSDPQEQDRGTEALNRFFKSRYLPKELRSFIWNLYGAMQLGQYTERLASLTHEKSRINWNEVDVDQLKTVYKKIFNVQSRHRRKETIIHALKKREHDLQTKWKRCYEKKVNAEEYLGFSLSEKLGSDLSDLIWLAPHKTKIEWGWKNLRNFFTSLYVLQQLEANPQARPEPEVFLQEFHAWLSHASTLKALFTNSDALKLAQWFTTWAYIVTKKHEWRRITGARRLFIGKLLGHKGIIRAAYQQGVGVDPQTLQDIQITAPLDCITPGSMPPIGFRNGNVNFSQDQWPTSSSAFLRYYLTDPQGRLFTQADELVHIDRIASGAIPVDAQPTATIELALKVPPSTVATKLHPNTNDEHPTSQRSDTSANLATTSQRWITTRKFSGKGLVPYLVHQSGRKYQRPTLDFSKLDANGLPILHFALDTKEKQERPYDQVTVDLRLPIEVPPKPNGTIRVLSFDPGTRNPAGYAILEGPEDALQKVITELKELGQPLTIKTLASSDKYNFSKWNITVLYEGVLAGLHQEAQTHAKALVWKKYTKNSMFATLEVQDRIIEKDIARIDRKIGHRYTEIQLLQKRKAQALVIRKHLAELLGCSEDTICLSTVKHYFDSRPELMNKTRKEQAQTFLQLSIVKDTPLANLTPEKFWNSLYDVPYLSRLEKMIHELYQKNREARRNSTHLLVNYLLEIADTFGCDLTAMEDLRNLQMTTEAKIERLTAFQQKIAQLENAKDLKEVAFREPTKTLQNRLDRFTKRPVPSTWNQFSTPKLQQKRNQHHKRKIKGYFDHLLEFLYLMAGLDPQAKARRKISLWTRGLAAAFLQRKLANRKDLQLVIVRPEGTSSRCCECHTEGTRNRAADTFKCQQEACKHNTIPIHSEVAASINIGLLALWHSLSTNGISKQS